MNNLTELQQLKQKYVQDEADKIVNSMIKHGETSRVIDTCDYANWDRELHRQFPAIADELRKRGFGVTSMVRHGVTEWTIVVL